MKKTVIAIALSVLVTVGVARAFNGTGSSATILRYEVLDSPNVTSWATAHGITDLSDGFQSYRVLASWLDYQSSIGFRLVGHNGTAYIFEVSGRSSQ